MPRISNEAARIAAGRSRAAIHTSSYDMNGQRIAASASIGIASYPAGVDTAGDVLEKVDVALYKSKQSCRDRSTVYRRVDDNNVILVVTFQLRPARPDRDSQKVSLNKVFRAITCLTCKRIGHKMLFLIGVNHYVQHDGRAGYYGPVIERLRQGFAEFIVRTAHQTHAKVIAEENNQEVLEKFAATKSVAFTVAAELGIRHLFCEPSIAERKRLGITITGNLADYEKREKYWLEKLRPIGDVPVLFIFGADHIASFSDLAKNSGLSVSIAEKYYGRKYFAS